MLASTQSLAALAMVVAITGCQPALTAEQQADKQSWQQWLAQKNTRAKDGRKSFLNIQDARYLRPGEQVAVDTSSAPEALRWQEQGDLLLTYPGQHKAHIEQAESPVADLEPGQEYQLTGERFITVGGLHDDGLRAFIRDPNHDSVASFGGFDYYDYDPDARVQGQFESLEPKIVKFQTIQGLTNELVRVGQVHFEYQGQQQSLFAYHDSGEAPFEELVFFVKDATNGETTYGGGRELLLELPEGTDQPLVLDFNYLVNLYCAHSTFWNCPVLWDPPLAVELEVGARDPKKS